MTFKIKLAGIVAKVNSIYDYIYKDSKNYQTDEKEMFEITMTSEDIIKEQDGNFPLEYLETLAVYRQFVEKAIEYDVMLFHSSSFAIDGNAYILSGHSGAGKSTHASLYRKYLKEKVTVINDDKPLIRYENGKFNVYGTFYDGKHRLSNNVFYPLKSICFIVQSKENKIRKLSKSEAYPLLIGQIYRLKNKINLIKLLGLIDKMLEVVNVFELSCDISYEAFKTSYETITK